ncbi:hypothetical protein [Nonomuraea maheshkhaliensis]|uniref:hypothetical protein n=1 Tax=Nonomuraea maheshkhaliensis TaxID=419590 RepID=UPI0031F748F1
MREPSGDQHAAPAPSAFEVSTPGSPPSMGSRWSWAAPPSAGRRNASVRPSGDQRGELPAARRRGFAPGSSQETSQISERFSSASRSTVVSVYATAPPSGRSAGSDGTAKRCRSSKASRGISEP